MRCKAIAKADAPRILFVQLETMNCSWDIRRDLKVFPVYSSYSRRDILFLELICTILSFAGEKSLVRWIDQPNGVPFATNIQTENVERMILAVKMADFKYNFVYHIIALSIERKKCYYTWL